MNFDQFHDSWPDFREGETFSNRSRIEYLHKEAKNLPSGRWLWVAIPLAAGLGKFMGWNPIDIIGACGALALFEIVDLLTRILKQNQEIKLEVELLKGGIRENRWVSASNHAIAMKTIERDEDGHKL